MNAPQRLSTRLGLGIGLTLAVAGCSHKGQGTPGGSQTTAGMSNRPPVMDAADARPVGQGGDDVAAVGADNRGPRDTQQTVRALAEQAQRSAQALQSIETSRARRGGAARAGTTGGAGIPGTGTELPAGELGKPANNDLWLVPPGQSPTPPVDIPVQPPPAPAPVAAVPVPAAPPPRPVSPVTEADGRTYGSSLQTPVSSGVIAGGNDAATGRLVQHIRDYPHDVAGHLDYQLDRFVRDETVPHVETMTGLPQDEREMLSIVLDGLSLYRTGLRADANALTSRRVRPLLDMADRLRTRADLTIPTLALCSRVAGYGIYDPMGTTFRAGQETPVILYCEVENFASVQNDKLMWQTRLSQEAVLFTDGGARVWMDKGDVPVDLSRNRRHDFYVFKRLTLPKTLGPGRYVLKVTIVDQQSQRVAENSMTVNLMAQ